MTNQEFRDLVQKMREAQIGYFKAERYTNQKRDLLVLSKSLEKQVDQELKKPAGSSQLGLF